MPRALLVAAIGAEELSPKDVVGCDPLNRKGHKAGADDNHENGLPALSELPIFKNLQGPGQSFALLALSNSKKSGMAGLSVHLPPVDEGW
jgi:hypothetical protein